MKNVNRDFYSAIRENRDSSYGFIANATLDSLRIYNKVINRNKEISERIRDQNGVYKEISQIIKNEANIHATNR